MTPDGNHMTGIKCSLVPEVASLEVNIPIVEPRSMKWRSDGKVRKVGIVVDKAVFRQTPALSLELPKIEVT